MTAVMYGSQQHDPQYKTKSQKVRLCSADVEIKLTAFFLAREFMVFPLVVWWLELHVGRFL